MHTAVKIGEFDKMARELALSHAVARRRGDFGLFDQRLKLQENVLRQAYQIFARSSGQDVSLSYASEWLLDNVHVVRQSIRQVREDMPKGFYRDLPKLTTTALVGEPRITAIALEIVQTAKSHLKTDELVQFVEAYQEITSLTIREIWALPTMLRMGVMENLIRAVAESAKLAYPVDQKTSPDAAEDMIAEDTVAGSILSLRTLDNYDWKAFFQKVNLVEQILRTDPVDDYALMDFETGDRYRNAVETLSLLTRQQEGKIAQSAIRMAQKAQKQNPQGDRRIGHVGYYLVDEGRDRLEESLGYTPSMVSRTHRWLKRRPSLVYLGAIGCVTLAILLILLSYARGIGVVWAETVLTAFLILVPVVHIGVSIINWVLTHLLKPMVLPKLDFSDGTPRDYSTMVVIPALLTDAEEVRFLLHQIELHFLGNSDANLSFALLTDFTDSSRERLSEDDTLLDQTVAGIESLNEKHRGLGQTKRNARGPFYLFHRRRMWNVSETAWMGWERKRGKLEEFNRLLLGNGNTSFIVQIGDLEVLPRIKYVITLDADTVLPRETARRLIGTLAHPLNRARIDPASGKVVSGYTVLQPRTEITPASGKRSLFTHVFAGDVTLDPYTLAVSNVYQDLFGEGIYVGKGIYEVAAFALCLDRRVPENSLLSHDLFEGLHVRVGLVSDIVLLENYPPTYLAYAKRMHRWIRGDWQLLPWLKRNTPHGEDGPLSGGDSLIHWWKIIHNLLRSLLAPVLLTLLICAWLGIIGVVLPWTLLALLTPAATLIVGMPSELFGRLRIGSWKGLYHKIWKQVFRWLLMIVFLPYEAWIALDAIIRTLVRLVITRKRLLEWTTAAHSARLFGKRRLLLRTWREMGFAPLLATGVALLVGSTHFRIFVFISPLVLAWFISPQIAYQISRPLIREREQLASGQRYRIRRLARRTWLFFEKFVGPDDNWLPPDHFQESPRGVLAHRTSPTNIGLMLLSTMGAFELGYLDSLILAPRLRNTFDTLDLLERHRGHLMNWYDTRTIDPLPPRYVSTVDSGNLACCLLAIGEGCLRIPKSPIFRWQQWQGLLDTLDVLDEIVEEMGRFGKDEIMPLQSQWTRIRDQILAVRGHPERWVSLLIKFGEDDGPELDRRLMKLMEIIKTRLDAPILSRLRVWTERVHQHLFAMKRAVNHLTPWSIHLNRSPALFQELEAPPHIRKSWRDLVHALPVTPRLEDLTGICEEARAPLSQLRTWLKEIQSQDQLRRSALEWCEMLERAVDEAQTNAQRLQREYAMLAERAEKYVLAMDFRFLFNPKRKLFHIGYNVETGQRDDNYYDLLASEARISSLVAVAKGDIPQSHWMHLGRPLTSVDQTRGLVSWSGSMFEYLMPILFFQEDEDSLLGMSNQTALKRHIEYGHRKKTPWGISESGYYRFDRNMNYQYRAFGAPGLGFKRGLEDDLVIAPYASLLALPLRPREVIQNVDHLKKLGLLGDYGFYESVDFTSSRLPLGKKSAVVRSFYAHHQGMIFLSIVNYLLGNVIVRMVHKNPLIQSVEMLLQEQIPRRVPLEDLQGKEVIHGPEAQAKISATPWSATSHAPFPQAHFLSNGRYGLMVTAAGGGFSRWEAMDLTRWRADTTLDNWGLWIYIQDRDSGELWSVAVQPVSHPRQKHGAVFSPHKIDFHSEMNGISAHTEIIVPPEEDMEIRRVTLTNRSPQTRRMRVASYGEVVLAPHEDDRRHPAFNKLFVESEFLPEQNGLIFHRRPRSAEESTIYLIHALVVEPGVELTAACESDRARFVGRGRTLRNPAAFSGKDPWLSGTTGMTLDPVMTVAQDIELESNASVQMAYITLVGRSRRKVMALASRYGEWSTISWAFGQTESWSELELRQLGLTTEKLELIQQLLSVLLYPHAALRADAMTIAANSKGQPGLWPFAVSGDHPILLVRIRSEKELPLVQDLLRAHTYWRNRSLEIDLVILNLRQTGYNQELQGRMYRLLSQTDSNAWLNQRGGIFLLRADQMNKAERILLETAARAFLDGRKGSLEDQLQGILRDPDYLPAFSSISMAVPEQEDTPPLSRPDDLLFDNGWGGFSPDGSEYVIYLETENWPPAPWSNVIANADFGFLTSEGGLGATWAFNSGENRLTSWSNDPVSDTPGEAVYLRDEETAQFWSLTPLPAGARTPYIIRHGSGYSVFENQSHGLKQRMRVFAALEAPIKVAQIRLENTWSRARRITVTYYAEWLLGPHRDTMQPYVIPEYDEETQALLARNPYNTEFGNHVAFLTSDRELHSLTTDRTEFLGRMGSLKNPAGLQRIGLSGTVSAGVDPCAAIQVHVDLAAGEVKNLQFLLGEGTGRSETLALIRRYRDVEQVKAAEQRGIAFWDDFLGAVRVKTPDPAMDLLLNRWLPYQNLSSRIWGRTAFYQSSGAYGFRDQLQDVMALTHAAPQLAREHILRAARHQFEAGDVLHWFHPPTGRGVRTRMSDDLLWLPFVTAHYVTTTEDESILMEKLPFLSGEALEVDEEERYGLYEATPETYTLYEHCLRAIRKGSTSGPHGLPLMGAGDWNDGMNRVGIHGKGESIWLGWFLCAVLTAFVPICRRMDENELAVGFNHQARELGQAIEKAGWDGEWYLRAFYDDGATLGSAGDMECRIDAIAQSWAVLSEAGDKTRAGRAMQAVAERLVRHDERLIQLLDPPFDKTEHDPGYIKGYPPGVRENGGQYTHAALWSVWAFARLGQGDLAEKLYRLLNPIYHADTPERSRQYRVEPYVVAADVYSVPPHTGRGGWTWYTGSSGWMYRVGLEAILGLRRRGSILKINPCIPKTWQAYEIHYRNGRASYHIRVENPDGVNTGVKSTMLDGEVMEPGEIPLVDDEKEHEVKVLMGDGF